MPVFRLSSYDSTKQSFANILQHFLGTLAKSGGLDVINLQPLGSSQYSRSDQSDSLLTRGGVPLAAVYIEVTGSQQPVEAPVYQGTGEARAVAPAIGDIDDDLAARMKAEMPAIPLEAPEPKQVGLVEMHWIILIRSPGMPMLGWEGGPFDTSKIEAAFNKLVDILVAATKPTPTV